MRRVILGAALMVGAVGVCGPVQAADDGYQNVFSSVFSAVGLLPPERSPEIDYRERPPLVLPPKQTLATPQVPGANRTAAWPQDPDVLARRKADEEAQAPMRSLFDRSGGDDRLQSKAEMLKHRAAQTDNPTPDNCRASEHSDAHCRLSPEEMRRQDAVYRAMNPTKSDAVVAGVEPDRQYLTQPPKGYLKTSKTVTATTEAPVIQRDASKPLSKLLHDDDQN